MAFVVPTVLNVFYEIKWWTSFHLITFFILIEGTYFTAFFVTLEKEW